MAEDIKNPIIKTEKSHFKKMLALWLPVIIVVVVVAYAALAWFMLISPKIGLLMPGSSYDFSVLKDRIAEDEAYVSQVDVALKAYNKIPEAHRTKVRHMVPIDIELPSLMVQLEEIAEKNAMIMEVIEVSVNENYVGSDGSTVLGVVASFTGGNYMNYKNLLNDLQNLERILDVVQTSYSPRVGGYQFTMNAYRLAKESGQEKTE